MTRVRPLGPALRACAAALAAAALGLTLAVRPAAAASVATWDKVAACESGGDWSINTGNGYSGGLQISAYNWTYYGGTAYAPHAYQATKKQQILIAEKILADQGAGAWTCAPGTGLSTDHADPYPAPLMTDLAAVGDQTGDGVPDIIAVERSTGKLFRYSGPDYAGEAARTQLGTGWNVYTTLVGVGDLTGDGVSDIIAYGSDGKLYRYSGPGYGGSTKLQIGVAWDSMANVTAVGDQTGDGIPDVIAVEKSTGKLFRYAGPDFDGSTRVEIGTGWNVYDTLTAVGDQNGDGVTDIIAADPRGGLFRYSGPGYTGGSKVQVGSGWDVMADLTGPGDLAGSGVPDLLAVDLVSGDLYRYSGPDFSGATRVRIGTHW